MSRLVLALILCVWGCDRPIATPKAQETRVISLSPAVTSLIQAMGQEHLLVGRSTFCRGCDQLPVVGDLGGCDVEALLRLQPTLVLHQRTAAPPPDGAVASAQRCNAQIAALPMDDMDDLHESLDFLAQALSPGSDTQAIEGRAAHLHQSLRNALQPATPLNLRVLLVQTGPNMLAWGEDTWLGDIATAAGCTVIPAQANWRSLTAEEIVRLAPETIFVLGETPDIDVMSIQQLQTPASEQGRIHVLSHPELLIPGVHAHSVRLAVDRALAGEG